jgi:hypothetical protein
MATQRPHAHSPTIATAQAIAARAPPKELIMSPTTLQRALSFSLASVFTVTMLISANVLALDNKTSNTAAQQWAQQSAHRA